MKNPFDKKGLFRCRSQVLFQMSRPAAPDAPPLAL
jgi:hypothetical protein